MSTVLSVLATPTRSTEVADGLGRVAAPAQAAERRHARVVPAATWPSVDQPQQLALAHHRVGEVQARELDLPRAVDAQLVEEPVVERPVVLVLQRCRASG